MANFVEVLTIFPVSESLLTYLEPRDLVHLIMTCHALQDFYHRRLCTRVDAMLSYFVKYASALRILMRYTGALISGSIALQFFSGYRWSDSDLDIYVDPCWMEFWGKYLEAVEGYSLETKDPPDYYTGKFKVWGEIGLGEVRADICLALHFPP